MPCIAIGNGKYRLGQKGGVYDSKEACERSYAAYLAKKHSKHHSANDGKFVDDRRKRLGVT